MTDDRRFDNTREIHTPMGTDLNVLSWWTESPLGMLTNNLDPEVAGAHDFGLDPPTVGGWAGLHGRALPVRGGPIARYQAPAARAPLNGIGLTARP